MYREELMDMYKNPTHKGTITAPSAQVHKKNPMCGDEVTMQLKIENGKITDAKFDGFACFVSIVSSEVLLESIKGLTIEEARKIDKEKLLEMVGLNLTTSRVKCATLALTALNAALDEYEKNR